MTRQEALDIFKCLAWHELRPSEEKIEMAFKVLSDKPSGKWIKANSGWICSECQRKCGAKFANQFDYCPNCSAKMDLKENEDSSN